jgi:hypothetical protein
VLKRKEVTTKQMKIRIDAKLYERARQASAAAGYSSVDEFVTHAIENEIKRLKVEEAEQQVADQLRGLGYIE